MITIPNWCNNDLTVRGGTVDIKKFKEQAKGKDEESAKTDLSLNMLHPMPEELENTISPSQAETDEEKKRSKELIKKYGASNWYDWKLNNWGTKWDVEATLVGDKKNSLIYTFDSAWGPPLEWLKEVSKKFPTLTFKLHYSEGGMCFRGDARAKNGVLDDQYEEGVCDDMDEDLDELN